MNYLDSRLPDAFWSKTTPEPNTGCWLWTAAHQSQGYGVIAQGKRTAYAHRLAFEVVHGAVPAGLELMQRCRSRGCANPSHFVAATRRAIMRAGFEGQKLHCKNGHEFTPENTYIRTGGGRVCKACGAHRQKLSPKAREWRKVNGLRNRLWQRFGLTVEQYKAMLVKQNNRCAICSGEFGAGAAKLHVDHDHKTGRVRGLLCMLCNNALGALQDDPARALRAAEYLGGVTCRACNREATGERDNG